MEVKYIYDYYELARYIQEKYRTGIVQLSLCSNKKEHISSMAGENVSLTVFTECVEAIGMHDNIGNMTIKLIDLNKDAEYHRITGVFAYRENVNGITILSGVGMFIKQ